MPRVPLTKKHTGFLLVNIATAALGAWPISSAHAVTTSWNTNSSGSFTLAANWDKGVPGSADTAVFNRGPVAYTVTFPGGSVLNPPPSYLINYLRVNTNEVTFADNSSPFITTPILTVFNPDVSIVVGENAGEVAVLNTTLSSLSAANASIGRAAGANGTLNVVAGTFSLSGTLDVGVLGTGALNVTGGGNLSSPFAYIGKSSPGTATVIGPGSTSSFTYLNVGYQGAGALTIGAGGHVSSQDGHVGVSAGSDGTATVTGTGSAWTISSNLRVGSGGAGTLTIEDGGIVSNGSSAYLNILGSVTVTGAGSTWTSDGELDVRGVLSITGGGAVSSGSGYVTPNTFLDRGIVMVDGLGSTWTIAGDLSIGRNELDFSSTTLVVSGGGAVSVAGLLSIEPVGTVVGNGTLSADVVNRGWVSPQSPGALDIDGGYIQSATGKLLLGLAGTAPGTDYAQLQVSGPVTLSGNLAVYKTDSFEPSAGDAFDILDWGSLSGAFSAISLPSLAAGLSWDTSQLYTAGVISVVGPPMLEADFDGDGDVDRDDLRKWQGDFGQNGLSDADDDGDSDGADFLVWQRQVGGPTVAAVTIPEPGGFALLGFAITALLRHRGPRGDQRNS